MYPISDGDLLLARLIWRRGEHHLYTLRYYLVANAVGTPTVTEAAFWVASLRAALMHELLTTPFNQVGTDVRRLAPTPGARSPLQTYLFASAPYGPPALPTQCCGLISFPTPPDSPASSSRLYVPLPPASESVSPGRPSDDYVDQLQELGLRFTEPVFVLGATGFADLVPVSFRRQTLGLAVLDSSRAARAWATQRRRQTGRRPTPWIP